MSAHLSFVDARSGCGIVWSAAGLRRGAAAILRGPTESRLQPRPLPPARRRSADAACAGALIQPRSTGGQLSSGYVLTSMYQTTHRANADTITPAQYQPRSASSLIGSSSLFREGLYTHSLGALF